jgi:hypothetical protein
MSNSALRKIRNTVARALSRGTLGRKWIAVKANRAAESYQRTLLANSSAAPVPGRPISKSTPLRRLLFICANMWERRELLPELQKICEVEFVDAAPLTKFAWRPVDARLDTPALIQKLGALKNANFDLVIVYLSSALLSDELLTFLRKTWPCPLVGMNLDDKTSYAPADVFKSWAGNYRAWAGRFDCNLSNSASMVDVYRADGFNCLYAPTGFHYDPAIHKFERRAVFDYKLSFVGTRKPERAQFVDALRSRGIHVDVFGHDWDGAKFTDEGWKVYRASQLNLGISYNLPGTQCTNLKNRDFECPGAGGCYITTFDWELANLLDVGKEILCYRDLTDFIEQYTWYSRRPDVCQRIAEAGHRRCVNEHTWQKRFTRAFAELGFA